MWKWKKHLIFEVIGCPEEQTSLKRTAGRNRAAENRASCMVPVIAASLMMHVVSLSCVMWMNMMTCIDHTTAEGPCFKLCSIAWLCVCIVHHTNMPFGISNILSSIRFNMFDDTTRHNPFFQRCPLSFLEMKKNIKEHKADFPISFSWNVNWTSHPFSKSCS